MKKLEKHCLHATSPWILNRLQIKSNQRQNTNSPQAVNSGQHNNTNNTSSNNKNIFMVIPYTRGLRERFKKTGSTLGIEVHFKGSNSIHILLMPPKDKDNMSKRCREDIRAPSPIHQQEPDHRTPSGFGVFYYSGQGVQSVTRTIKETMYIQVNNSYGMRCYRTFLHCCSSNPAPPTPFHSGLTLLSHITWGTHKFSPLACCPCPPPTPMGAAVSPSVPSTPSPRHLISVTPSFVSTHVIFIWFYIFT